MNVLSFRYSQFSFNFYFKHIESINRSSESCIKIIKKCSIQITNVIAKAKHEINEQLFIVNSNMHLEDRNRVLWDSRN